MEQERFARIRNGCYTSVSAAKGDDEEIDDEDELLAEDDEFSMDEEEE